MILNYFSEAPPPKLLILDFKTVTTFSIWWSVFLDNWYIISRNKYSVPKKVSFQIWMFSAIQNCPYFFGQVETEIIEVKNTRGQFNFSHSEEKVERASHTFISTSTWQNLKVRTVLKSSEFQNVLTFWIWWRFDGVINERRYWWNEYKNMQN